MRLDDSEAALAHLQSLVSLAERLRGHSIAVLSHQYDYLAFGSWMLVAGNRHRRAQVTWDGKESMLSTAVAILRGSSDPPKWQPAEVRHLEQGAANGLYQAVEDFVVRSVLGGAV